MNKSKTPKEEGTSKDLVPSIKTIMSKRGDTRTFKK